MEIQYNTISSFIGLFYALFVVCILAASNVVASRNPVYSLLNLVLFFLVGSLHLLTLGVDFLAFVFIIVYVGALAVLFLFVVIMLNIKANAYKFKKEVPLILLFSLGILFLVTYDLDSSYLTHEMYLEKLLHKKYAIRPVDYVKHFDQVTPIKALGFTLYTKYLVHFVLCGLILLVAIIGAIVLTSKSRLEKSKASENASKQHIRSASIGKYKTSSNL